MAFFEPKLFTQILTHSELLSRPPVLVDIGASGEIHSAWKKLAPYSTCIAFDADRREMAHTTSESAGYKQLHVFHAAVVAEEAETADFHLTNSPFCSSLLKPDNEALKVWDFADLFQVKEKTKVPCVTLAHVLQELNLEYIDWFKTDSQGTDLRLFLNIPANMRSKIIAAEFEPGLIDAYAEEDKLTEVLQHLTQENFWLSSLNIKGPQRLSNEVLNQQSGWKQRLWRKGLRTTPGWGEMVYFNSFYTAQQFELRDYLLGWLIATLQQQHGFAYEMAQQAIPIYSDSLLIKLKQHSEKQLTQNGLKQIPLWLLKKLRLGW